jgi:glycosidase
MMKANTSWLKEAIIYNIFIDRFSVGKEKDIEWSKVPGDRPEFCGGNIRGIIERLDYLSDLGINTILLTPFNTTTEYHGYHVTDFFGVDPRFGTLEDIKELIAKSHQRNIRIIMDFVVNHVSDQHPYFLDARTHLGSPYRKWFTFKNWPDDYLTFLNFKQLPKLNLENPETVQHILDGALFWVGLGFDALRIDHVLGVSYEFISLFEKTVKNKNPDLLILGEALKGEIYDDEMETLKIKNKHVFSILTKLHIHTGILVQLQYAKYFDGLFDFSFRDIMKNLFTWGGPCSSTKIIDTVLKMYYLLYPKKTTLISVLDNPDKDRFIFALKNDRTSYFKAVKIQFEQKQPPMIFYGSEVGLSQEYGLKSRNNGDLAVRAKMPWHQLDQEMLSFYKKLIQEKKGQEGFQG